LDSGQQNRDLVERAAATAREILAADPAIGPLEVIYVDTQEDVRAIRFAMFVYAERKLYFFDREKGRTTSTPLRVSKLSGVDQFQVFLEEAKSVARSKRFGDLFVVKRDPKVIFFAKA